MTNKSSKSPSGEDRESGNPDLRKEGINADDIQKNTAPVEPEGTRMGQQENLKNRGVQEDQPGNPVRGSGSTSKDQESGPAGEPEESDL